MSSGQGDIPQANKSIPDPHKIPLLGRNVLIKKLRLGEKFRVSSIFAKLAKALKGDNWIKLGDGTVVQRRFQMNDLAIMDMIDSAPNFLHEIEVHYKDFLLLTSDVTLEEIDDKVDMPDLVAIASETWEYNGFEKAMEQSLGKVLKGGPAQGGEETESVNDPGPSKT